MVRRDELTDEAWAHIEPLFPVREGRRGGRWRDHRTVVKGILWHLYSGAPLVEGLPWDPDRIVGDKG